MAAISRFVNLGLLSADRFFIGFGFPPKGLARFQAQQISPSAKGLAKRFLLGITRMV